jgi:hypothetical protein
MSLTLVGFVYDPDRRPQNAAAMERDLSGHHAISLQTRVTRRLA